MQTPLAAAEPFSGDYPRKVRAGIAAAVLAALFIILPGETPAQAAEMSCDALIGKLKESGEFPNISINPADETVRVVTSEGACSESIEAWSQRPPLPKTKPRSKTGPTSSPASPQPRPRQRYFTPEQFKYPVPEPPKPSGRTAAPAPSAPAGAKPNACDRRLENFWNVQVAKVEGVKHWLSRVFTLDMDGDRHVDNVSFTFIDEKGSGRIVHYFGVPGGISGSLMPTLKLPDDGWIKRLCFGDLSFQKPEHFGQKPLARKWIEIEKPDLAGQMEAKEKGIVYKPKVKKKEKPKVPEYKMSAWDWALLGGGLFLLLAAVGGGVYFIFRGRKSKKGDDDEDGDKDASDDEEDEDDDEDEEDGGGKKKKSKKGLGSFLGRFKKKKAAKDEDDEDEDDPAGEVSGKPVKGGKPGKKPKK